VKESERSANFPSSACFPKSCRSRISENRSRDQSIALRDFTLLALTLAAVCN